MCSPFYQRVKCDEETFVFKEIGKMPFDNNPSSVSIFLKFKIYAWVSLALATA